MLQIGYEILINMLINIKKPRNTGLLITYSQQIYALSLFLKGRLDPPRSFLGGLSR